jgi:hypothetical protein
MVAEALRRIRVTTRIESQTLGGSAEENGRITLHGTQTTIDDQGILTVVETRDYVLGCGHLAKGRENVAGMCGCGRLCCNACLSFCAEDGAPLCPKHTYRHNGRTLCEDHYLLEKAKEEFPWF